MTTSEHEAFWSARYRDAGDEYLFGTAPNTFLASQAPLFQSGQRVLAVADGEGRNSVWLAEQGLEVVATEISPVVLEKAGRLARGRSVRVDFCCQDILQAAWPPAEFVGAFDFVVAIFIQFVGPEARATLFHALQQTLKPGGCLVIQGYTPKQLEYKTGGPSALENLYTAELLQEAFAGWEFLHLREHESLVAEGLAHQGMSALVDAVIRKPA